jgi:hypothetical protein
LINLPSMEGLYFHFSTRFHVTLEILILDNFYNLKEIWYNIGKRRKEFFNIKIYLNRLQIILGVVINFPKVIKPINIFSTHQDLVLIGNENWTRRLVLISFHFNPHKLLILFHFVSFGILELSIFSCFPCQVWFS